MGILNFRAHLSRSRTIHWDLSAKGPNQSLIDDCVARELEELVLTCYLKWRPVVAEFHQASEEDGYVGDFALLEDREVLVVHIS